MFSQKPPPTLDDHPSNNNSFKPLNPLDETYFHIVEIVGSEGRYQTISLTLWCLIWFLAGQLLLGTPFLLYNPPYQNCPPGISQTCNDYICQLPLQQRSEYLNPQFNSLAMEFGDYHCENAFKIEITETLVYFGSFVGYFVVSWMNDNLGRKKSIIIGLVLSLIGILMIASSINLLMAQIGMFIAGFGIDPSISTVFYFIGQTVENRLRQKHSTIVQFFFSLAGIINVLSYLIFKNWRPIVWILFVVPAAIAVFLIWRLIEETPQFMIMFSSREDTIRGLKNMAKQNGCPFFDDSQNQRLLQAHIQKLKRSFEQKKLKSDKKYINFWDMFKYPSIRYISVYVCILSFNIYLMYYGPLMLMEKYDLNVFVSAVVLTTSDIVVYPLIYFFVERMSRRLWGKFLFGLATGCGVGLFLVTSLEGEIWKVVQMGLIFVFRFAISFYFVLFLIYSTELFPAQIKGVAIGFASALGTIASTSSPIIFGQLQRTSFPIMLIFVGLGVISLLITFNLPETLNVKLEEQLQEFGQKTNNEGDKKNGKGKNIQLVEEMGELEINSKNDYMMKITD